MDNLTTNYVSSLICTEELKAIANRKEKHENMQVGLKVGLDSGELGVSSDLDYFNLHVRP